VWDGYVMVCFDNKYDEHEELSFLPSLSLSIIMILAAADDESISFK
jgi:hypothetical protein